MEYTVYVKLAPDSLDNNQYLVHFKALNLDNAKRLAKTLENSGDSILCLTETIESGPYHNCEKVLVIHLHHCDECGENKEHPDNLVPMWYTVDGLTYTGVLLCHDCQEEAGIEYIEAEDGDGWEYQKEKVVN